MKTMMKYFLFIFLSLILLIIFIHFRSFNHEGFPRGKFHSLIESPNNQNTIKFFGNEGNATGGGYIRVEVQDKKKNYTIFFDDLLTPNITSIEWEDENNININGDIISIDNRIEP